MQLLKYRIVLLVYSYIKLLCVCVGYTALGPLALLGLVCALVVVVVVVVFEVSVVSTLCFAPPAGKIMTGIAVTVVPVLLNAVTGLLGTLAFEYAVCAGTFVVVCVSCDAGSDCSGCVPSGVSTN